MVFCYTFSRLHTLNKIRKIVKVLASLTTFHLLSHVPHRPKEYLMLHIDFQKMVNVLTLLFILILMKLGKAMLHVDLRNSCLPMLNLSVSGQ